MKNIYTPFFYKNLPACGAPGSVLLILALFSTPHLTGPIQKTTTFFSVLTGLPNLLGLPYKKLLTQNEIVEKILSSQMDKEGITPGFIARCYSRALQKLTQIEVE